MRPKPSLIRGPFVGPAVTDKVVRPRLDAREPVEKERLGEARRWGRESSLGKRDFTACLDDPRGHGADSGFAGEHLDEAEERWGIDDGVGIHEHDVRRVTRAPSDVTSMCETLVGFEKDAANRETGDEVGGAIARVIVNDDDAHVRHRAEAGNTAFQFRAAVVRHDNNVDGWQFSVRLGLRCEHDRERSDCHDHGRPP